MSLSLLAWVLGTVALGADAGPPLRPTDLEKMFLPPGHGALRFTTMGTLTDAVPFTIRDYTGRQVATGKARLFDEFTEADVDLPRGYYELEMPGLGQLFGVVVGEPASGDPQFAIDAALSWLVRDDLRGAYIRILRRSGIDVARERFSWNSISQARDRWNWETPARYDSARKKYAEEGLGVLELTHEAPRWMGRVGKYPDDLAAVAAAWEQLAGRWQNSWAGVELWNEPDIAFGDFLPGDQYAAYVKALAYAQRQADPDKRLVGGAWAHFDRPLLDAAARNGLLGLIDVLSFHTYEGGERLETLVGQYRQWLAAQKHPALPLWITESGRPWKRGPARPPRAEDAASALDIVVSAVEARACGVAKFFAFIYPFFEEGSNNFGMMGREGTPLRSMAGYTACIRLLGGKRYLGDLKTSDDKIRRLRVFGDERETIAVAYTGTVDPEAGVTLGVPVAQAAGLDGRELTPSAEGRLPVPDGLAYAWLDRQRLAGRLQDQTEAMRLYRVAQGESPPPSAKPSPIVLRFQFASDALTPSTAGYTPKKDKSARLPLAVRAFNFTEQPLSVRLMASAARFGTRWLGPQQQTVELPGHGSAEAQWEIDLSGVLDESADMPLLFRAEGVGVGDCLPLSVDLLGQPDLKQLLPRYGRQLRLKVEDVAAWQPNVVAQGAMKLMPGSDQSCRMVASFSSDNRWAYPRFSLPAEVSLKSYEALLFRVRCVRPAEIRVMLWEGAKGVCYYTMQPIAPADGRWHTARVRFQDLTLNAAQSTDPNGRLDLEEVRALSVGMNSQTAENALEVREMYAVGK